MVNEFTETVNSQDTLNVVIHWGISGLDRSVVKAWDASSSGKLIWDEDFTILPAANQQALLDLCQSLRQNSTIVYEERVTCWIEEMKRYVEESTDGNMTMPIDDDKQFLQMFKEFIEEDFKGVEFIQTQ